MTMHVNFNGKGNNGIGTVGHNNDNRSYKTLELDPKSATKSIRGLASNQLSTCPLI